jgi:hypothetical protein
VTLNLEVKTFQRGLYQHSVLESPFPGMSCRSGRDYRPPEEALICCFEGTSFVTPAKVY